MQVNLSGKIAMAIRKVKVWTGPPPRGRGNLSTNIYVCPLLGESILNIELKSKLCERKIVHTCIQNYQEIP